MEVFYCSFRDASVKQMFPKHAWPGGETGEKCVLDNNIWRNYHTCVKLTVISGVFPLCFYQSKVTHQPLYTNQSQVTHQPVYTNQSQVTHFIQTKAKSPISHFIQTKAKSPISHFIQTRVFHLTEIVCLIKTKSFCFWQSWLEIFTGIKLLA